MDETKIELQEMEDSIIYHKKEIAILKEKLSLGKNLVRIVMDNIKPKSTTFEYQDVPEFWALQKELTRISHEEEQMQQEQRIVQLGMVIELKEGKLKELKGE